MPEWKIIHVTNEKLKLEKLRRIYMFGIDNSYSINIMYLLSYSSIILLLTLLCAGYHHL